MDEIKHGPILRAQSPLQSVAMERIKQDAKWGLQDHGDLKWLSILMEEVGEVALAVNEDNPFKERLYSHEALRDNLEYELVQVAAVCVAWVECMRRKDCGIDNQEPRGAKIDIRCMGCPWHGYTGSVDHCEGDPDAKTCIMKRVTNKEQGR